MTANELIQSLSQKSGNHYFFIGNNINKPMASTAYVYDLAFKMKNDGLNVQMVTNEGFVFPKWLDKKYSIIQHISAGKSKMTIKPEDIVFLTEVNLEAFFKDLAEAGVKALPCEVVVIAQSHELTLAGLTIGTNWAIFGVKSAIVNSESMKQWIDKTLKYAKTYVVPPLISEHFSSLNAPQTPSVAINCKNALDGDKIVKEFHLRYPHLQWIPFDILPQDLSRKQYAERLKKCSVAVWVDSSSSFGTFPLECMRCGIPVIGRVPEMRPDWMTQNNGYWVNSIFEITSHIADVINLALNDDLPNELLQAMDETVDQYSHANWDASANIAINSIYDNKISRLKKQLQPNNE